MLLLTIGELRAHIMNLEGFLIQLGPGGDYQRQIEAMRDCYQRDIDRLEAEGASALAIPQGREWLE